MFNKIKSLLGNIPRQTFLFYNKQQIINVIIGVYEQSREVLTVINEFIDKVNSGEFNGINGQDGAPGEKGEKGEKGEQGIQGIAGPQGPVGPEGPKGDKGEQGEQGPKGDKGETGETGPQGERGYTGERGERGERGGIGPQGPIGLTGPKGDPFTYSDFTTTQLEFLQQPAIDAANRADNKVAELNDIIINNNSKVTEAVNISNQANVNAEQANTNAEQALIVASGVSDKAEKAINIAKGRATGYVFDTKADLDDWLSVAENKAKLQLGDNLYIRAINTPDYWWDGSSIQKLETEHPDLTDYVKNTDYATNSTAGVVKVYSGTNGLTINNGILGISAATTNLINAKTHTQTPIVPANLDHAVKVGVTTNTITLTDTEKANAKKWLGFTPLTQDEYEALTDKTGINFVIPADYDN